MVASPRGGLRRRARRLGHQLARRRRAPRSGRLERLRARARGAARRRDPYGRRLHAARLHARGAELLAPALHGRRRVRGARRRARPTRARVPEHRPPDRPPRSRTARPCSSTTSLEANVAEFDRSARATAPPGSGSSTGSWRTPTSRSACSAPSCGRAPGRSDSGAPAPRPPGPARVRRRHARLVPRLDDRDVPLATGARAARARGCCTRGSGPTRRSRVHDPGDRLRDPARRDAGARGGGVSSSTRSRGSSATRAGSCARTPTSSASSSRTAAQRASRSPAARR